MQAWILAGIVIDACISWVCLKSLVTGPIASFQRLAVTKSQYIRALFQTVHDDNLVFSRQTLGIWPYRFGYMRTGRVLSERVVILVGSAAARL